MKRWILAVGVLVICLPVLAGYKLVFQNGATLELTEKPDLTLRLIQGVTMGGKYVVVSARFVDIPASERLNEELLTPGDPVTPKPEAPPAAPMQEEEAAKPVPSKPEQSGRETKNPLVITSDTIPRRATEPESESASSDRSAEAEARRNVDTGMEEGVSRSESGYLDDAGRGEAYWRGRFENNRSMIQQTEKTLADLQLELNRLAGERLRTDDEVYRRRLIGEIEELETKKQTLEDQLARLKREKRELQQEARRSGALPGWYRDYVD